MYYTLIPEKSMLDRAQGIPKVKDSLAKGLRPPANLPCSRGFLLKGFKRYTLRSINTAGAQTAANFSGTSVYSRTISSNRSPVMVSNSVSSSATRSRQARFFMRMVSAFK